MHVRSAANDPTHPWEPDQMSFGARVRALRTRQGLSAKELSAKSGVPEKAIYRIETEDVKDPGITTATKLVRALACSADELLLEAESFGGDLQLRSLFENTARTSKRNQELVAQVVAQLNMADTLRHEIMRPEIEKFLSGSIIWRDEAGDRPVTLDDLNLPADTIEYFKKNPREERPEPEEPEDQL